MQHQEKKYRVASFEDIERVLNELNLQPSKPQSSTNYYALSTGLSVTKLVVDDSACAIHVLDEDHGKFNMRENIPVKNLEAGLQWLRDHGFDAVNIVHMNHTDYEYNNGVIGLYTINDSLKSVILDYPAGSHEDIEHELGLTTAETITVPYNIYLQQQGQLKITNLEELN